jgi:hypothetical protein
MGFISFFLKVKLKCMEDLEFVKTLTQNFNQFKHDLPYALLCRGRKEYYKEFYKNQVALIEEHEKKEPVKPLSNAH